MYASAIMLESYYRGEMFWRCSYVVMHEYGYEMKQLPEFHNQVDWQNLRRQVNDRPVVTKEEICWDDNYDKEIL